MRQKPSIPLITVLLASCQGQQSKLARAKSILDLDHQFDSGSGISVSELTRVQVENLVTLGKVWGSSSTIIPASPPGSDSGIMIYFVFCPQSSRPREALFDRLPGLDRWHARGGVGSSVIDLSQKATSQGRFLTAQVALSAFRPNG